MEQYFGLSLTTLVKMRDEFTQCLDNTIRDNNQYPKDPHLYRRIQNLCTAISSLTEELLSRNDEILLNKGEYDMPTKITEDKIFPFSALHDIVVKNVANDTAETEGK